MRHKFTITQVDLDAGYATLDVTLPDGTVGELVVDTYSIVSSDQATELEIVHALRQLVEGYVNSLFPEPLPQPEALLNIVGRTFDAEVQ